jgi:flagellar motor switch protein FliG
MKQIQNVDSGQLPPVKGQESLSGAHRSAILLAALGEDLSASILKQLSREEVQQISHALASTSTIKSGLKYEVLRECDTIIMENRLPQRLGVDFAKQMLTSAFGADTAGRILEKLPGSAIRDSVPFRSIQRAEPEQLAKILEPEHPQTIAIVLSRLSSTNAAALLHSLSPSIRVDVALRMASLEQISPDVIHKIVTIIGKKLTAFGQLKRESFGGVRAVADVLNQMDGLNSKEILDAIDEQDTNLAEAIRHLMFVFEDLLLIDVNGMKELVGRLDRKVLVVALKGTSEQLKAHFTQCMSQRGAAMMLEDMEALGPVKIKEVQAAQKSILDLVRQLESEGTLSVKGEGAAQYVA